MSEKGLLASICGFFKDLFSSDSAASTATSNTHNDGLTGVERYIRDQASKANQVTGVEAYIRNQANAQQVTSVEAYIRSQANAQQVTGVEAYIRNQS